MINEQAWKELVAELNSKDVQLVAVSKTKPVADVQALYDLGQRVFGENYVQELVEKQPQLPSDIQWHYIGHLQSNKVKYIAPFVSLIHAVDSMKLLEEINKQAAKNGRVIDILLQVYIAEEESKFGLDEKELTGLLNNYEGRKHELSKVRISGLMGMASFSEDAGKVRSEFAKLTNLFRFAQQNYFTGKDHFRHISMGMSGDYKIAVEEGSTMVRIGSMLFGSRN